MKLLPLRQLRPKRRLDHRDPLGIHIKDLGKPFAHRRTRLQIDPVDHVPAHLLVGDNAGLAENTKVMRSSWLRKRVSSQMIGIVAV